MTNYRVMLGTSIDSLMQRVNEVCADGWEPIGGLVESRVEKQAWRYAQAMVKRETSYTLPGVKAHAMDPPVMVEHEDCTRLGVDGKWHE